MNSITVSMTQQIAQLIRSLCYTPVAVIAERHGTFAIEIQKDGVRAVLKTVVSDDGEGSEYKSRLLIQEARILEAHRELTGHLYIDAGSMPWGNWLLLRKVEGRPLIDVAKDANVRGLRELMKLLTVVSGFYAHLYEVGVLHGDVQPSHILIENDLPVVIDSGLATYLSDANPLYRGGFVYHVAPEIAQQMRCEEDFVKYTVAAEVYAIASTLFFVITGEHVYDFGVPKKELRGMSMQTKLDVVIQTERRTFADLGVRDVPEGLEEVIGKALNLDPALRFANPTEMHHALATL